MPLFDGLYLYFWIVAKSKNPVKHFVPFWSHQLHTFALQGLNISLATIEEYNENF